MKLVRKYAAILRKNFRMHAAWMPLTTPFALGDYGLWRRGVFTPLGNIREFGAQIQAVQGSDIQFDFVSATSRQVRLAAGSRVGAFGRDKADSELQLSFDRGSSFLLKAERMRSTRMANVQEVTRILNAARRRRGGQRWRLRYKVVREVFTGFNTLVVATQERETRVSLRGSSRTLRAFEGGSLTGKLEVSANKQLGLSISGGEGVIGLGLFRVTTAGIPSLGFTIDGEDEDTDDNPIIDHNGELVEPVDEDMWDMEPTDDDNDE